jgi:hypothetical protein
MDEYVLNVPGGRQEGNASRPAEMNGVIAPRHVAAQAHLLSACAPQGVGSL